MMIAWSTEQDEKILTLATEGYEYRYIARHVISDTPGNVRNVANRLQELDAALAQEWLWTRSESTTAANLGLSDDIVRLRLSVLSIPLRPVPPDEWNGPLYR